MFTVGGSRARLFRQQGSDLGVVIIYGLEPFFTPCGMATGPCSQHIESIKMSHYAALFMRSCLTFMTFMAQFHGSTLSPVYWTRRPLSLSQQRSQQSQQRAQ